MDIVERILSWPIIVQGALGSALFWLTLVLGQRIARLVSLALSKLHSDQEVAEFFSLCAWSHRPEFTEISKRGFFICLYAAVHYLLKALIVIVISFLLASIARVFAAVGYVLSIYYLFRALSYVPHLSTLGDVDERLKKLVKSSLKHPDSQNEEEDS